MAATTTPATTLATAITTTPSNSTSTLSSSSSSYQSNGFCFSCGFNFGHIADGVDDTTMGMILVGITILVIVAIASGLSCYIGSQCCCKKKKDQYKKVATNDSNKEKDVENAADNDPSEDQS